MKCPKSLQGRVGAYDKERRRKAKRELLSGFGGIETSRSEHWPVSEQV